MPTHPEGRCSGHRRADAALREVLAEAQEDLRGHPIVHRDQRRTLEVLPSIRGKAPNELAQGPAGDGVNAISADQEKLSIAASLVGRVREASAEIDRIEVLAVLDPPP